MAGKLHAQASDALCVDAVPTVLQLVAQLHIRLEQVLM